MLSTMPKNVPQQCQSFLCPFSLSGSPEDQSSVYSGLEASRGKRVRLMNKGSAPLKVRLGDEKRYLEPGTTK